ncbi:MAG: hypothetical protein CK424_07670 [Legionella sp.]|nr:MAG: hypothetical protein CK424_07670 [Legionella sp.]
MAKISDTEQYLFNLTLFPVFDMISGLKNMHANQALFIDIIKTIINQEFPTEKMAYEQAYAQQNWEKIEKLAHKMKGGCMYTGLTRLQYACQYLEDYYQSNQTTSLDLLYQQLLHTIDDTQQELVRWLESQYGI